MMMTKGRSQRALRRRALGNRNREKSLQMPRSPFKGGAIFRRDTQCLKTGSADRRLCRDPAGAHPCRKARRGVYCKGASEASSASSRAAIMFPLHLQRWRGGLGELGSVGLPPRFGASRLSSSRGDAHARDPSLHALRSLRTGNELDHWGSCPSGITLQPLAAIKAD